MSSFTYSESTTFTLTHAKYLSSKVGADLKRMQRFYGSPSDELIESYEKELTEFLRAGYLKTVSYGFKKDGNWIEPSLIYEAKNLTASGMDDDPGKIKPGADISNASFFSFLSYSDAWWSLTDVQREVFKQALPFIRSSGPTPGINGYVERDKSYFSGGMSFERSVVRKI